MKKILILAFVLVYVVPSLFLLLFDIPKDFENEKVESPIDQISPSITEYPKQEETWEADMYVSVLKDLSVERMTLEEYVLCVVLAEMPADFEQEALKAQAVVARTYTLRKIDDSKHNNAHVCADSSCCQAYLEPRDFLNSGGTYEALQKVDAAVRSTAGEFLTYQGKPIEATYFSCSGGKTEDAAAVWGADIPYLRSVSSPGEEAAVHFTDTVRFSANEFCELLGIRFFGDPGSWIGEITYTNGGGVDTIVIQEIPFSGTELRQRLGLRSTAFVITATGHTVTVTTKGFGHRVGMSQYGAEAMAVQGSTYQDILKHYYTGTSLSN